MAWLGVFWLSMTVAASEPIPLDVELARNVGDGLFAAGDPTGALQWYRVARWLEPSGDELDAIDVRIAMGLEATGLYPQAATQYAQVADEYADLATFRAGVCRFRSGASRWGEETFAQLVTAHPGAAADVSLVRGMLWLEAGDADAAATAFASIPLADPRSATAAGLAARSTAIPLHKSPALAASLSIVPGIGQMYAGDAPAGFRNLAIAGVLGTGSMMMMKMGDEGTTWAAGVGGALLTTATIGWTVNIIGAWKRAETAAAEATRTHAAAVLVEARDALPTLPLAPSPAQLVGDPFSP